MKQLLVEKITGYLVIVFTICFLSSCNSASITDKAPPDIVHKNNYINIIDNQDVLLYSISDLESGLLEESIKVKINDKIAHDYAVSYYNGILHVKEDHGDEFGGGGSWETGALKIQIEASDKALNKSVKLFNYTVRRGGLGLNTIDVRISPSTDPLSQPYESAVDSTRQPLYTTTIPAQLDFSFSAESEAPIVKYEWAFSESVDSWIFWRRTNNYLNNINFDMSKAIEAGSTVVMGTYLETHTYTTHAKWAGNHEVPHIVILKVTDSRGNFGTAVTSIKVTDGLPKIKILGDNPVSIRQGSVYIEDGAYAHDYKRKSLIVSSVGLVDMSIVGQYYITYSAEDDEGNRVSKERLINVIP